MNAVDAIDRQWAVVVGLGFPLALLLTNELVVRATRRAHALTSTLRSVRNFLLPALGFAAMVRLVLGWPVGGTADQVAQTMLWIVLLYVALAFVNDVVFGAAQPGTWRANVPDLLRDMVRSLLIGIGAAFIYSEIWGKELAGALAALGVGSLVLGLALQEPLGNVFSGIMLMFERPVAIGDWIQVDNFTGRVISLNWRAVNIETRTREMIIVPNSSLYKTSFVNLSRPTPLRTENLELGFSYDDPPNKVKAVLLDLLRECPGVLADPPPVVHTHRYADFSIIYLASFTVGAMTDFHTTRDEVMTRLWYAAQRAGLTIPYPISVEVAEDARALEARRAVNPRGLLAAHPHFQTDSADGLRVLHYSRGEFLLAEGDQQDGLGLLLEGEAVWSVTDRAGQPHELGRIGPGDFYGEHSLLAGEPSTAGLRAATDVRVVLFDLEASRRLTERSPALARRIGEAIERRQRSVQAAHQRRSAEASAS